MNRGLMIRLFICIVCLGGFLYAFIRQQNTITKLRLQIPMVVREVEVIQQENVRLQFLVDQFEDPLHLMELARQPEFRHLKHPLEKDIRIVQEVEK